MRPSREAFEEILHLDTVADALDVYEAQEAQIRELADALEALCAYTQTRANSKGDLFVHVREVLARARGAS